MNLSGKKVTARRHFDKPMWPNLHLFFWRMEKNTTPTTQMRDRVCRCYKLLWDDRESSLFVPISI